MPTLDIAPDYRFSAHRLRAARDACGLTQNELHIRSGVSLDTIKRLESLTRPPTSPTLTNAARLAHVLGCALTEFLEAGE